MKRFIPNDSSIESLLQTTSTERESLTIGLRNQRVELARNSPSAQQQRARHTHKTVKRTVHFIYFDSETHRWTGNVHRNQTDWQKVTWNNSRKKWQEAHEAAEETKRSGVPVGALLCDNPPALLIGDKVIAISREEYNRLKQQQDSNKE